MEQYEIDEKLGQGWLRCSLLIEVMGAPKEHVESTIKLVMKKLSEEKGVDVISEKVHPAEEKDKMFSTFSEVDVLFRNFETLTRICFDYMPSSMEILKPEQFRLPVLELSNFVSDMLASLHHIDFKLKDAHASRQLLERNSANLLKNFILHILGQGSRTMEEISGIVGVKAEQLEPFVSAFSREGMIRQKGGKWEKA